MPSHNAARDASLQLVNRQEQMEIYDRLPARWRALVGALPTPQELSTVEAFLIEFGETRGFDEIVKVFQAKFPGWRGPGQ